MSWDSSVLTATLLKADSGWAGEGCTNETVPLDIGVQLRFERRDAASDGEDDDDSDEGGSSGGGGSMELIARNRRGVDIRDKEGQQIQGKLEIDVAAIWDYGLSDEEAKQGEQSLESLFACEQDDDPESDMRFEVKVRGRVAEGSHEFDDLILVLKLETPFGVVNVRGRTPRRVYERSSGKEEETKAEHCAVGQWVTVKGFPCFDIE